MTVCFNTLNLSAPPTTADRLLAKAFESCDLDDWGISPQNFSFDPFIDATRGNNNIHDSSNTIWTNWIDRKPSSEELDVLMIEFETESEPPLHAINALIKWLDKEKLDYDLKVKYRLENDRFQGEVKAQAPH